MINRLNKFTRKSFKNYSMPENIGFNYKNVIFGYNGRGKSSLAEEIVHQFNDENGVRFFHRDYVEERLLVMGSDSDINGVKVAFGKPAINVYKEIEDEKNKIIDLTQDKDNIKTKRQEIRGDIDQILISKKGSSNVKIKNKQELSVGGIYIEGCSDIDWVLKQYENDLNKAKNIITDIDELREISGDIDYDLKISELSNLSLPIISISCLTDEVIKDISKICAKTYINDDIPRSEVVKWLSDGLKFHKDDDGNSIDKCIFCKNNTTFDIVEIENRINLYLNSEKQKDSETLKNTHDIIDKHIKRLSNKIELSKPLLDYFDEVSIDNIFNYDNELETLKSIEIILSNKLESMSDTISLGDIEKIKKDIKSLDNKNEDLINLKFEKNIDLANQRDKQNTLINAAVKIAIDENENLNKKIEKLKEFEKTVLDKYKNNQSAEKNIKQLEDSVSEYGNFRTFLNEILRNMSINLKLEFISEDNKKNYYITQAVNDGDSNKTKFSIKDISEGEKNLLALLFFYYEMYNDGYQKKPKDDIKLVVIDDPVSSLDDANKTYVIEMIKKILEDDFEQVFVLTHSWNDFCDIVYGKEGKKDYDLFEIVKYDNIGSSLIKQDKKILSPYNKLFKEIYELSILPQDGEIDDCKLYHTPNSMRRVLEEFLSFKVGRRKFPTTSNFNIIKELYEGCKTNNNKISSFDIEIHSLLNLINTHSHKPLRSDEVKKNAKTLMRYIEITDKFHYDKMKQ